MRTDISCVVFTASARSASDMTGKCAIVPSALIRVRTSGHASHAKADTTANEYMQELPESMKRMVGSVYAMLTKGDTLLEIRVQKLLLTPSSPL